MRDPAPRLSALTTLRRPGRAVVVTRIVAGSRSSPLFAAGAAYAQPTPRQVNASGRRGGWRRFGRRRRRSAATVAPRSASAALPRRHRQLPGGRIAGSPAPRLNGRLYERQAGKEGFCSATAIDSPTRRLVLTAGHCVNSGPKGGKSGAWSAYLEFVPGFNLGAAPRGTFVLPGRPRALPDWTREGNPDFDLGAFLTAPSAEGAALADAVSGGATIVTDRDRHQRFETFGYPGGTERMRTCASGLGGEDPIIATLPGPNTIGTRCDWAPGTVGGCWLIDGGHEIDGLTSYIVEGGGKRLTYGAYFSASTVGHLVAGL